MVLAIAMGDMGTVTNDEKRGHVSWVTSTGQHKLSWGVPDVAGRTIGKRAPSCGVHPAMVTRSVGRKIGHRCPPWVADMIWDMGSMAHMMAVMDMVRDRPTGARSLPCMTLSAFGSTRI